MKEKILYLHVGWSKTGTSAVQYALNLNREKLLEEDILYPESIQWNDHSHHHFAMAFSPVFGYEPKYTPQQAIELLKNEINSSQVGSVLISSELSPFYFCNEKFNKFVASFFEKVIVLFTVRPQSEILLSLFNQLVKDPNVRYKQSLFSLAMNNIPNLNYFQHISRWENRAGKGNVIVCRYGKSIVEIFFASLGLKDYELKAIDRVNPSLPIELLLKIQAETKEINEKNEYIQIRDNLVENFHKNHDASTKLLFSAVEQANFDSFFYNGNCLVAKTYLGENQLFKKKSYEDLFCID